MTPARFLRRRPRAGLSAVLLGLLLTFAPAVPAATGTAAAGAVSASADQPAVVKPTQELAILLGSHLARKAPYPRSAAVAVVSAERPITGEQTVLPVIAHRTGPGGLDWLRVRLPGRPNGLTGWISKSATRPAVTSWHVVVTISGRQVLAYRNGRLVRVFKAVVGKPSTPTPQGKFFVEEVVQLPAGAAGAPFALALSSRSDVFQEFAGGPGQTALHGVANIGGVLGTAVSHGCVRLDTDAIRWLAERIGPGAPVTVTS